MANDLVKRLRDVGRDYDFHENALIYEAADRIEALNIQVKNWKDQAVDALDALLDVRVERNNLLVDVARKDTALEALIVAVNWEAIPAAHGDDVERRMKILLDCANEASVALAPIQENANDW